MAELISRGRAVMSERDSRDIFGGIILIIIGGFVGIHSLVALNLGTISNMGPGMFPAAIGFILLAFGVVILVMGFFRSGVSANIDLRSFAMISASVLAFAMILQPFGLIPAVFALTLVASRADSKLSLGGAMILATGLSVVSVVIFQIGLGMPVQSVTWPW